MSGVSVLSGESLELSRLCVPVHALFAKKAINASREWVSACVSHCLQSSPNANGTTLAQLVLSQWLETDLRGAGVQDERRQKMDLDQWREEIKTELPRGKYTVQILTAVDIGESAYSQRQKLNRVDDANSRVSADAESSTQRPYTAAWQPVEKTMRKMLVTNGTQTVYCLEHEPLPQIPENVPPGFKMTIQGPLIVRRGIIFLTRGCVTAHGGHVEELDEACNRKQALQAVLKKEQMEDDVKHDLPTQTYVPIKEDLTPLLDRTNRSSGNRTQQRQPGRRASNANYNRAQKSPRLSSTNDDDPFADDDDDDDLLLAEVDLSAIVSNNGDNNGFNDDTFGDDDEFMSQMEMP